MADIFNLTDTWNSSGTTFTSIKMNVTDTASAAGSLLQDLQVGGVSKYSVSKNGNLTCTDLYVAAGFTHLFNNANGVVLKHSSNNVLVADGNNGHNFQNLPLTNVKKISLNAGATAQAPINMAAGVAPTTPSNGDIWFDGTDLKMRIGGVTKTFTLT